MKKDTERLPAAYHAAGVREFWLVDARGPDVRLTIHRWEPAGWAADPGPGGTCRSAVFACGFTVARSRNPQGRFVYDLIGCP